MRSSAAFPAASSLSSYITNIFMTFTFNENGVEVVLGVWKDKLREAEGRLETLRHELGTQSDPDVVASLKKRISEAELDEYVAQGKIAELDSFPKKVS